MATTGTQLAAQGAAERVNSALYLVLLAATLHNSAVLADSQAIDTCNCAAEVTQYLAVCPMVLVRTHPLSAQAFIRLTNWPSMNIARSRYFFLHAAPVTTGRLQDHVRKPRRYQVLHAKRNPTAVLVAVHMGRKAIDWFAAASQGIKRFRNSTTGAFKASLQAEHAATWASPAHAMFLLEGTHINS